MSRIDDNRESAVRISLLDVMYGVVIAYGFSSVDNAEDIADYFRFLFAIAIFVVDWVYAHSVYWGEEYKKNMFLVLDIGILFSISRLLFTATTKTSDFFLWLAILFGWYVIWSIVLRKESTSRYALSYGSIGDCCAIMLFILIWMASKEQFFLFRIASMASQSESAILTALAMIVYIPVVKYTWFTRVKSAGR